MIVTLGTKFKGFGKIGTISTKLPKCKTKEPHAGKYAKSAVIA